jgi:hypothetical protein
VRLRFLVICCMACRLPVICAVLRFCGMLRSVIITIMNSPIKSEAKPSLMLISVGLMNKMRLSMMRVMPSSLARICGWCSCIFSATDVVLLNSYECGGMLIMSKRI